METKYAKILLLQMMAVLVVCQDTHDSLPAEVKTDFFPVADSPLDKPIHSREYVDFINKLYSHDTSKIPIHLDPETTNERSSRSLSEEELEDQVREKRAIIFRPLFVYKQQQIRREKLKDKRKQSQSTQQTTTSKPNLYVPANHSHYIIYNNKVYTQYNPYYAPYQYGQKFPYQKW
ncbi:uncharacterized protein LOC129792536 [Lutzomyia longipalpis]|uniref:Putative conserved secreted protein n=1 Tax=Lutzomyia longipalpis TaxID=7200 RepID=A0A1B0GI68_LUTLO|nr:uncharacterized protein LOC129792536 [Lutzomyia longipalpis]